MDMLKAVSLRMGENGCMGIPKLPKRNICQVKRDLLESIALEEAALAHLIHAEAAKVQRLADYMPEPKDFEETAEMQKIILAIMQATQLKELLLLQKLRTVGKLFCDARDDDPSDSDCASDSDLSDDA